MVLYFGKRGCQPCLVHSLRCQAREQGLFFQDHLKSSKCICYYLCLEIVPAVGGGIMLWLKFGVCPLIWQREICTEPTGREQGKSKCPREKWWAFASKMTDENERHSGANSPPPAVALRMWGSPRWVSFSGDFYQKTKFQMAKEKTCLLAAPFYCQ